MFYDKRLTYIFYFLAFFWGVISPVGSVIDNPFAFFLWAIGMNAITVLFLNAIDNLNPDKPQ